MFRAVYRVHIQLVHSTSVTSNSEALGQRRAGSNCHGPRTMWYSTLVIKVTGRYGLTVVRGSTLRSGCFTGQRTVDSRSYLCSTISLLRFGGEELLSKEHYGPTSHDPVGLLGRSVSL